MRQKILLGGEWRESTGVDAFQSVSPITGQTQPQSFPISNWEDCEQMLNCGIKAYQQLRHLASQPIAHFLEDFADRIERNGERIVKQANIESGLPISPRLQDVELPRTISQLREAATAARDGSWRAPVIDVKTNIRSCLAPIGAVCVIGPNNFPLAFGGVSGGDFAAAIAAGNPVIAKAHPLHPETARLFAEAAVESLAAAKLPPSTVQMFYQVRPEDGERLVSDPRLAATAFTGSRAAGLRLKRAAESTGRLIFLEMSSINPVVVLPGALAERGPEIAQEFCNSVQLGGGQFCTKPGLMILIAGPESDAFADEVVRLIEPSSAASLMSQAIVESLQKSISVWEAAGARMIAHGGTEVEGAFRSITRLMSVSGAKFLRSPELFQTEAFGNASLLVIAQSVAEAASVLCTLEGNLTGCIYSAKSGGDDDAYKQLAEILRDRVGRLLNDKMPTGVAISPAMHHGGPFPSTGQAHFTAVGMPGAIRRFTKLECYDNVREHRLPVILRDGSAMGAWRMIDGCWTQDDVKPRET
jgi:alpha-ketoglutaric semialdehyde dehydrogenase